MLKRLFVIAMLLLLCTGCARLVTDKSKGLIFDLTLTTRDTIDLSKYRYYLVMSLTQNPVIAPFSEYFPAPGALFDTDNSLLKAKTGGLQFYYQNYFSTWSDYIVVSQKNGTANAQLFSSGGVRFDPNTTLNSTYTASTSFTPILLQVSGNQLRLQFSLNFLASGVRVNYNLVAVEITDGSESGIVWDSIDNATPTVLMSQTTGTPFTDLTSFEIPGPVDIVSYQVSIL